MENNKESLGKQFIVRLIALYVLANAIGTVCGLSMQLDRPDIINNDCYTESTRIGKVMPGMTFGCWLGETPSKIAAFKDLHEKK